MKLPKHIELKDSLRVRVSIPADLQKIVGKGALIKALGTRCPKTAERLGRPIIDDFLNIRAAAKAQFARQNSPLARVMAAHPNLRRLEEISDFMADYGGEWEQPPKMINVTPMASPPVKFDAVIEAWEKMKTRSDRAMSDCRYRFRLLSDYVEHNNASELTSQNMGGFLMHLLDKKIAQGTVQKYLAYVKATLAVATDKAHLLTSNPAEKVSYTATESASRQDGFSMAEMSLMVNEARKAVKPIVRIPVLISAYSGACLAEIVEASPLDFEETKYGLVFHIRDTNRTAGQCLKTEFRPRRIVLHVAIADDVRGYLKTLPLNSPLFPQVRLDPRGGLAHNAGEHLRKWIRKTCGINRKGEAFHCYRHTFKTVLRRVLPKDVETRNYITGHADRGVAADYGRVPLATLREVMDSVSADPMKWDLQ